MASTVSFPGQLKPGFPETSGQRCVNTRWPFKAPFKRGFVVLARRKMLRAQNTTYCVFRLRSSGKFLLDFGAMPMQLRWHNSHPPA